MPKPSKYESIDEDFDDELGVVGDGDCYRRFKVGEYFFDEVAGEYTVYAKVADGRCLFLVEGLKDEAVADAVCEALTVASKPPLALNAELRKGIREELEAERKLVEVVAHTQYEFSSDGEALHTFEDEAEVLDFLMDRLIVDSDLRQVLRDYSKGKEDAGDPCGV